MRPLPNLTRAGLTGGLAAAALACAAGCAPDMVLPEPPPAPATGWALVNPRPFEIHVTDTWGPTPDRMFAVGLYGGLLVREGENWRLAPAPTDTHLWDIHGCDWEHVYAVAADGLHFFDGKRWRREGPADLDELARVHCLAPDDVMVVTGQRTSHHWDGRAWTSHELDLEPGDDAREWLAGAPAGNYLVSDGRRRAGWWTGDGWRFETSYTQYGIRSIAWSPGPPAGWYAAGADGSGVWLARLDEGLWRVGNQRDGNGFVDLAVGAAPHLVWQDESGTVRVTNPGREDILVEHAGSSLSFCAFPNGFLDNDFLVAAGTWGALVAGPAAEPTLPAVNGSVAFAARGFHVWPDGDFAAWDDRDGLLVSRAGALTVTDLAMEYGMTVGVWGPHPGLVYAVGYFGDLYVLREGAAPERLAVPNEGIHAYTLAGGGDELWAGCWEGLARWDGEGWTVQEWPFGGIVSRLAVGADGEVWAASSGALGRWDGASWHAEGPAGALSYHDVVRDPASGALLIIAGLHPAKPRDLLRLVDGEWQNLGHPGDHLSRVYPGPGGAVYAICYGGVQVWRDGNWSPVPPPGGRWDLVVGSSAGGDPSGGLYVFRRTGGIHHLDLGGLGIWR
ncbi:MAG: hypothetical protein R6X35_09830 [Candidatus Krumholzibacteriia bacterium]